METLREAYHSKENSSEIRIIVEKVRVEGRGVIILTGPSSCGKGEVGKSLSKCLSIPKERYLSMGEILRGTIQTAKNDEAFKNKLADRYSISYRKSIFDSNYNREETVKKAVELKSELISYFKKEWIEISQFDWLEYCVNTGMLIPDEWTINIIDAAIENSGVLQDSIFILDGYPRTVHAAEKLLDTLDRLGIPIIKVLFLSITKNEMKNRARGRNRHDDTEEGLERRYDFFIEKVQPSIDYMKERLGDKKVALIDAHQPVFDKEGKLHLEASINNVVTDVMDALKLPSFLHELSKEK